MAQFKRSIAIIIGVNQYQNGIPALKTAVNDATQLAQVLKADHGYQVVLLRDQQVSLAILRSLLTDKLPALVQPDDRVLFYFAGHGLAFNGDDGPEGYLIPQDANLGDSATYLPMTLVHDALTSLTCRHFLGIFDCCFAGAFRWSATRRLSPIPQVIHKERFARFLTDPAWQVITSAADDQEAMDALSIKDHRGVVGRHSPFAEALIKALQANSLADASPPPREGKPAGDGVITATELYQYLRDAVEPDTTTHAMRQTPGLWPLKNHGKGEFVFMVPGREPDLPNAPKLNEAANPYRGLESFEEQHQHLFFGRKQLIQELQDFVEHHSLTVVLGASGTGKSSLVKAGLVPALKQNLDLDGQPTWQVLPILRPGVAPLKAILQTLPEPDHGLALADLNPADWADHLLIRLQQWQQTNPERHLLLLVDQAEELFSLCRDGVQRQRFLDMLAHLLTRQGDRFHVVITLRSDFEPQFRNSPLEPIWGNGRFVIRPMNREELRAAIEAPASAKVMYFEPPSLVDRLIDEVTEMPGALPLLSFTLRELFLKYLRNASTRSNRAITEADYEELGGIKQALVNRAEAEYHALADVDPAFATTICYVMLRMVATSGTGNTRRQVLLSELEYPEPENARVQQVLSQFKEARLLVGDTTADAQPYVEPAHDALVEGWPRLLQWLEVDTQASAPDIVGRKGWLPWKPQSQDDTLDEREKLLLQRRLTPAANDWQREQKAKFLWNTDPRLPLLKQIKQQEPHWFNKLESEFVLKSIRRKNFNTRRNWGVAIAVILGLSGLTIATLIGQRNAQIEQISASRQAAEANLLSNQELDALVSSLQAAKTLQQSLLLRFFKPETQLETQVRLTLQKAVTQVEERNRIVLPDVGDAVAFSPDGQLIATAHSGGKVSLWKSTGEAMPEFQLSGQVSEIQTLAFTSDGQQIITVDDDQALKFWSLSGQQIGETSTLPTFSNRFAIDPTGKPVLNSSNLEASELRNIETGESISNFSETDWVTYGAFSPDGKLIAAYESAGSTINIFDVNTRQVLAQMEGSTASSNVPVSISFSPDGTLLATGGFQDDTIYLWDTNGNLLAKFLANQGGINAISFSSDGTRLASAGADGTLRIWQNLEGKQFGEVRLSSDISEVDISSDGQLLATIGQPGTGTGGTVEVINLSTGQQFAIPQQFGTVAELLLSPDNTSLVVSEENGTVHRVSLNDAQNSASFGIQAADINQFGSFVRDQGVRLYQGLSFSQDGSLLAVGGDNNLTVFTSEGQELAIAPDSASLSEGNFAQNWVQATAFSPDNELLAAVRVGGNMRILKSRDGEPLLLDPVATNTAQTLSIAFDPAGNLVATAGLDGSISGVRLWKISGNQLEQATELVGHSDAVSQIIFSPDGNLIATAGEDGTARIWNLSGQQLAQFEGANQLQIEQQVAHIAFSLDGQQLILAYKTLEEGRSSYKAVKTWQIKDTDQLLKEGCDWVRDYLKNNASIEERDRSLCDGIDRAEVVEAPNSELLTQIRPGGIQNNADLQDSSAIDQVTDEVNPLSPSESDQAAVGEFDNAEQSSDGPLNHSEPDQMVEEDFYTAGQNKIEQEDYQGAVESFSQAIEADPGNAIAYRERAFSHYKLGDRESAFGDYSEASKLYEQQGETDAYDELKAKLHELWTVTYTGGGYTVTITGIGNDATYQGCDASNNCLELAPASSYQQGNYVWVNGNYQYQMTRLGEGQYRLEVIDNGTTLVNAVVSYTP